MNYRLVSQLKQWWEQRDLVLLLGAFILALGTWGFINLSDVVQEGKTQMTDEWVLKGLRDPINPSKHVGPKWLEEVGRDLTALGGVAILGLVTCGVLGYLLLAKHGKTALFVAMSIGGGLALSLLMKNYFDRPRPDVVPHGSLVYTSSYPSGHSLLSAVTYLTLGALLARVVPQRRLKVYFVAIAILATLLVGLSRVYVGVHYPSDVLAGWTAGLLWALLCGLVARYLQRRGTLEQD